jgi:hypothetical protein
MNELSRRSILTAGAAMALAPAATSLPARAAAPPAGKQAAGFYRYKVGDFECTSINDGVRTVSLPDWYVRNAPKADVLAAAEAAYMPKGMIAVPFNPQLINTGSKLILIDCGMGGALFEASKGAFGRTVVNLAAAGVDPKDVDIVVMSHLTPMGFAPPTARWFFRTRRSWCRKRIGRSG